MNNEYLVNPDSLRGYPKKVNLLIAQLLYFSLNKIDRSQNLAADKLAKIASRESPNDQGITMELLTTLTHVLPLQQASFAPTWINKLRDFITSNVLPENKNNAKQIQRRVTRYTVINDILYNRSFTRPLLRCILPDLTQSMLEEMHEGVCGGHPRSRPLAKKIINQGFYWLTLRKDV